MIAIIDYGMGNLRSAQKGLEKAGHEAVITYDRKVIDQAGAVVLPGVGAYRDCYAGLKDRGLVDVVKEAAASGRPFLGICVGLQLMFESSEEGNCPDGLGIFKGKVVRFPGAAQTGLKVPHMGWNRLKPVEGKPCPLLAGLGPEAYAYFVHSYYAQPEDNDIILATCEYGMDFPAMVGRGQVYAVQFHPEKSQKDGLEILRAFGALLER